MIEIRTMEPGDVDAVGELEKTIFTKPWSVQGFLDSLRMENTIFLVAEEDGQIAGYIGMYCSLDEGEITNVAVDAARRCCGIGDMLIKAMKQEAEQHAVTRLILEVRVSNQNAIHLYEKNGFKKLGVRRNFYELPREDAYIMCFGQ